MSHYDTIKSYLLNEIQIANKSNKKIYFTNGESMPKKNFNIAIRMFRQMLADKDDSLEVSKEKEKLGSVRAKLLDKQALLRETAEVLEQTSKRFHELRYALKPKPEVPSKQSLLSPLFSSCRFICGTNNNDDFVMVFYSTHYEFENSHLSLEKYYRASTDDELLHISGGFYTFKEGNSVQDDVIELFGSSSTYHGLYKEWYGERIKAYLKEYGLSVEYPKVDDGLLF